MSPCSAEQSRSVGGHLFQKAHPLFGENFLRASGRLILLPALPAPLTFFNPLLSLSSLFQKRRPPAGAAPEGHGRRGRGRQGGQGQGEQSASRLGDGRVGDRRFQSVACLSAEKKLFSSLHILTSSVERQRPQPQFYFRPCREL